jgi:hypothetical protein
MLGREPRSAREPLMVYAGILAHGMRLTAAECARMIPQLSAISIRHTMRQGGAMSGGSGLCPRARVCRLSGAAADERCYPERA